MAPVQTYIVQEVGPHFRRGLDPIQRWQAQQEMRLIARELRQRGLGLQPLPQPQEFERFLERERYISRGSRDPWGSVFILTITRDSIVIGSPGPDRQAGTADDLRFSIARH